jgi:hypothetical protein
MSLIVQLMYHLDISQLLRDVFVVHKDMVNVFWFVHNKHQYIQLSSILKMPSHGQLFGKSNINTISSISQAEGTKLPS